MFTNRDLDVIVRGAVRAAYEAAAERCDDIMREAVMSKFATQGDCRTYREAALNCAAAIRKLKAEVYSPSAAVEKP